MALSKELNRLLNNDGSEVSVVAYGQTGTGKTYTTTSIEGRVIVQLTLHTETSDSVVCLEQLAREIFECERPSNVLEATISILEIRGLAAFDLLSEPALSPVKISVAGVGASYQGLSTHTVKDSLELLALIRRGRDLRMTRSTSKNDTSSRYVDSSAIRSYGGSMN